MFEIYVSSGVFDALLAETLNRIELSENPADKRDEASNAWFQIWGMRKLLDAVILLTTALDQQRRQQDGAEHEAVKKMLDHALMQVDQISEALDGEAAS